MRHERPVLAAVQRAHRACGSVQTDLTASRKGTLRGDRAGTDIPLVAFTQWAWRRPHGRPSGEPLDVLTGFIGSNDKAHGRPVGVAMDQEGALLVADDVGNTVWCITPAATKSALAK